MLFIFNLPPVRVNRNCALTRMPKILRFKYVKGFFYLTLMLRIIKGGNDEALFVITTIILASSSSDDSK